MDLQTAVEAYRNNHWHEVLDDIGSLVAIKSTEDLSKAKPGAPFGPGPKQALEEALRIAEQYGFETHNCDGYIGYADIPGKSSSQVAVIGHVDVVPAGPGWTVEPYRLTMRDGYLLGRGVLDDKGPLMVALHAARFWLDRGEELPYTIRIIFGADEETAMSDVAYYRKIHQDPAFLFTPDGQFPVGYGEAGIANGVLQSSRIVDGCIVDIQGGQAINAVAGEASALVRASLPQSSDERIKITQIGERLSEIKVQGLSAHASRPNLGVNAIGLLVKYLLDTNICTEQEQVFLKLLNKLHQATDGSGFNLAVGDDHLGTLTAVGGIISIADGRISQTIDFRYPTTIDAKIIEERVNEEAQMAGASFVLKLNKDPFLMQLNSAPIQALMEAYGQVTGDNNKAITSKGGTYARCFTTAVSFGVEKPWESDPSWVGSMHAADEGVSEALLQEAFTIYALSFGKLMECDFE